MVQEPANIDRQNHQTNYYHLDLRITAVGDENRSLDGTQIDFAILEVF